jgi:LysM repeat protein
MKLIKRILPVLLVVMLVLTQYGAAFADTTYVVQAGDTLYRIAQKFNVNPAALISANSLTNPNLIYVGQRLIIPSGGGASAPVASTSDATGTSSSTYIIQPGDTLYKIMLKFNVSASALISANNLTNPNLLFVGQRLIIPGVGGTVPVVATQPAATAAAPVSGSVYVVQSGDTLYKIALKLGVDAASLIAANHLTNPNLLYVGQQLAIPGGVAPTAVPPTAVPATAVSTAVPTATPVPPTAQSPTATPVPPSGYNSHGIQGISFSVENTTASVNANVWFNFEVVNNSSVDVSYSALAGHTDAGFTAWSWTNQHLQPGEGLKWRDHINFSQAGTYQVYLGICYAGDTNACKSQAWDRLSSSVTVVIQ